MQVDKSPPRYAMQLFEVAMRLSKQRKVPIDKKLLTEKVYLSLLDDLDDERQTSHKDLLDILEFVANNALSEIFESH
jgi:hypothetical protein